MSREIDEDALNVAWASRTEYFDKFLHAKDREIEATSRLLEAKIELESARKAWKAADQVVGDVLDG